MRKIVENSLRKTKWIVMISKLKKQKSYISFIFSWSFSFSQNDSLELNLVFLFFSDLFNIKIDHPTYFALRIAIYLYIWLGWIKKSISDRRMLISDQNTVKLSCSIGNVNVNVALGHVSRGLVTSGIWTCPRQSPYYDHFETTNRIFFSPHK